MHYLLISFLSVFLSGYSSCSNETKKVEDPETERTEIRKETYPVDVYTRENKLENYATAIFAGGCFWCTEAAFERINGVVDVISGYSGGEKSNPSYGEVGSGRTKHAEAIYIYFDKEIVTYQTLLKVLMVAHNPTTLNYQGPDYGPQYRSAIFYQNEEEKTLIEKQITDTNNSGMYKDPVVTQIVPYEEFWVAEKYHQNYYELNPNQGYVAKVSRPKVLKVKKHFPTLIKEKYKK